mmetsp:Transcript_95626/g.267817  ORF Transcript_95626/g.267817 Transcript_95626/m.267817 type:complete len:253 (+) Transcript_95626:114-872(+)
MRLVKYIALDPHGASCAHQMSTTRPKMLSREPCSLARLTKFLAQLSRNHAVTPCGPPPFETARPTFCWKMSLACSSLKTSHKPSLAMIKACSPGPNSREKTSGMQLTPELFRWWSPSERDTLSCPPTRPCRTMPPSCTTRLASAASLARWSVEARTAPAGPRRTALESPTFATWTLALPWARRWTSATVAVQPLFHAPIIASWPSTFRNAAINASRGSLPAGSCLSSDRTMSCIFASQYFVSSRPPCPSNTA